MNPTSEEFRYPYDGQMPIEEFTYFDTFIPQHAPCCGVEITGWTKHLLQWR
ncbi:MAG: hypothetical protein IT203_04515 [Fimbriimonadaceae bacterium]|nr:hypothetical protein [Fimbriimonadaceae bacterium]